MSGIPSKAELIERFEGQWKLPRQVHFVADQTGRTPRDADLDHDFEDTCRRWAEALGGPAGLVCGRFGARMLLFGHWFAGTPTEQRVAAAGLVLDVVELLTDAGVVVSEILTPASDDEDADLPSLDGGRVKSSPPLRMDDWLVWLFQEGPTSVLPAAELLDRIEGCGVAFEGADVLGFGPPSSLSVDWTGPPRRAVETYATRVLQGATRYRSGTPSLTVVKDGSAWSLAADRQVLLIVLPPTAGVTQIRPLLSVVPDRTIYAVAEAPSLRRKAPDKRIRDAEVDWTASYYRSHLLGAPGSYVPTWGLGGDRGRALARGRLHLIGPGHLDALGRRQRARLTPVTDDRWLLTD